MSKKTGQYILVVVEESANRVGFYDPETGRDVGGISTSLWPHEICVASDVLAYISNFGVRDYDLSLGYAGNSISVIDTTSLCEVGRLFTQTDTQKYWAPHGVKVSPDERFVYVNVEGVLGVRKPDLTRPGSEFTKLLKFKRDTGECVGSVSIPIPSYNLGDYRTYGFSREALAYDVLPGTHNFEFSPQQPDELWLFSGRAGVSVMDLNLGRVTHHLTGFNGAVRGLHFGASGLLLVSATNEVSLVDPSTKKIVARYGDLGVGQILYSVLTPDGGYILAPAVWEGMVLVIDAKTGKVLHRISSGVDPVKIVISPDEKRAYVTHGRSLWISYIELDQLDRIAGRIQTQGGPNGMAFASLPQRKAGTLVLGACLPFTGWYSTVGREIRLGLQHWQDTVNASGGLKLGDASCRVEIAYADTASSIDKDAILHLGQEFINTCKPAALVGSYPASADRWLGEAAEEAKIPFISPLGDHPALFDGHHRYVLGLTAPEVPSLAPILSAVRHRLSPKPRSVAIVAADREDFRREASDTAKLAVELGFEVLRPLDSTPDGVLYHSGSDPGGLRKMVAKIRDLAPDLFLVVSDQASSILIVEACEVEGFRPGGVALSCGITTATFKDKLGGKVHGLLGGVRWTAGSSGFAEDRFGASEDFARTYFDNYSEPGSSHAALGALVGVCLERAVQCGCGDTPDALIAGLRKLDFASFTGAVRFDDHGRNKAYVPLGVQLLVNPSGVTESHVWPASFAGDNRPLWPRP